MDPYSNLPGENLDSVTAAVEGNQSTPSVPKRNGLVIFASWSVIILLVFGLAAWVAIGQFFLPKSFEVTSSELLGVNLTAKMLLGYRDPSALNQAEQFNAGPLEQRYGFAILVNEISGPEAALSALDRIDAEMMEEVKARQERGEDDSFPTESQVEIRRVLGTLFEQYETGDFDSSGLAESDRDLLGSRLGWVSKLALIPPKSPDRAARQEMTRTGQQLFRFLFTAMLLGIFALFASFAAVFLCVTMFAANQVDAKFQNKSLHGFVYLETFAIWLVLFFGSQYLALWVSSMIQNSIVSMALSSVVFFGSLIALAWPMIRGIPFKTLRKDIGWELGNPLVETAVGGYSYLALLIPMVLGLSVSVLLGIGLSFLVSPSDFESAGPAGHPIAEDVANGGPYMWIPILIAACVAAPIVEETMFRGVLYRYLRDATNLQNARWISVAVSSLVGGLIFAMVHPQGLVGIPVLTTLAIGFALVREWRNSLIGPIVMHAINNTIVMSMLIMVA